jgi:hypothetical protein
MIAKVLPRLIALLSRLPADRAGLDLGVLAVLVVTALVSGLALQQGWLTAEQLPSALDAAWAVLLGVLPLVGVRGASLAAKASEARAKAKELEEGGAGQDKTGPTGVVR